MKSSRIVSAIAALSLAIGSVSGFAQGSGIDPDRTGANNPGQQYRNNGYNQRNDNQRNGNQRNNVHGDNRGYDRSYDRNNNARSYDQRDNERRADRDQQRFYYSARSPEFRRGGYIPYEYRSHQYYVNDWRGHRLSAPPRGYQWVQVGPDYVLIAIATGLIVNLILNQ